MNSKITLVVTSISGPSKILRALSSGANEHSIDFILIGDVSSPRDFKLEGCRFFDIDAQRKLDLKIVKVLPEKHYGRKNIGYLLAAREGASQILETDDDNMPYPAFWNPYPLVNDVAVVENCGWVNLYAYFTDQKIWPRGFPLEFLEKAVPEMNKLPQRQIKCPVHQGLANENPDVDAVYRLTYPLPVNFEKGRNIALGPGSWCPFNSQVNVWFREAFMLMYLPSYCSFRMTDIWRSFVAQRILHENDMAVLFTPPTVWQERNDHNLLKDFQDEIPGYLNNDRIMKNLWDLDLKRGTEHYGDNMLKCYDALIRMGIVGNSELEILDAWINDIMSE
jgi:hypothetical protein